MQCVILAGGLGTRMWPDARTVPKTLLPVAGRPFAGWQLSWLAAAGITSVVYSIGHLGQQIRDYVGDGSYWGVAVDYVDEGPQLRGTAGALRLAADSSVLAEDFLVLYGDSWLQVNPAAVMLAARASPMPALMTVYDNAGRWDGSNVIYAAGRVVTYRKGVADPPPEMHWIDYGLLAFRRHLIVSAIPPHGRSDLAPLCSRLADDGRLAGYEVSERFYEIGSPTGRVEADAWLRDSTRDTPERP